MLEMTRWTAAHRGVVLASWVLIAVGLIAAMASVGMRGVNDLALPNTGSQKAIDILSTRFPAQAGDTDQIVFTPEPGT